MKLSPLAMKALKHWEEFRPKAVQKLREEGNLKKVLEEAAERATEEMTEIEDQLREQHPKKNSRDYLEKVQRENEIRQQAREIVLPRYILLPPENQETTDSPMMSPNPSEEEALLPEPGIISKLLKHSKR